MTDPKREMDDIGARRTVPDDADLPVSLTALTGHLHFLN